MINFTPINQPDNKRIYMGDDNYNDKFPTTTLPTALACWKHLNLFDSGN